MSDQGGLWDDRAYEKEGREPRYKTHEELVAAREAYQLSRRSDPETSHAAAKALGGKAGTMRRRLLEVYGLPTDLDGLTAEEAALVAGYTPGDGAWKRVSDLLNLGLVAPTGRTRPGTSGREQRVLRITEKGREALS